MEDKESIQERLEIYKQLKKTLQAVKKYNQLRNKEDNPKAHLILGYNTGHISLVDEPILEKQIQVLESCLNIAVNVDEEEIEELK